MSLQFLENVYIDKLKNMVNKYNNTYHRTIKMELLDVKSSKHIDFEAESNDKGPNFKVDDVRISKYKIIFEKELEKRLHSELVRRSFCYYRS